MVPKGCLVKNIKDEYGIVTDQKRNTFIVLQGDGLKVESDPKEWMPVKMGSGVIDACFPELLSLYDDIPDPRIAIQNQRIALDRLAEDIDNAHSKISKLEQDIKEMKEVPKKVMERVKGKTLIGSIDEPMKEYD